MRVIAQVVARNEADRWLEPFLEHLWEWADQVHFYDDQSTDDTPRIASRFVEHVTRRPDGIPSFVEHEGLYRQAAWDAMTEALNPTVDDWIWAIDCDEFIAPHDNTTRRDAVTDEIRRAQSSSGIILRVPEVWDSIGVRVRTDGYWGSQEGLRAVRFSPGMRFADKPMACGQTPPAQKRHKAQHLSLLHFGYTTVEDREAKYARYSILPGHSKRHIESIVRDPRLQDWPHPFEFNEAA